MITGTVIAVDRRRGDALIQPHDDLPPVAMPLRPDLQLGARVRFLIETDRLGNRRAVDVTEE
jgi:cold shock CspA family protein